MAQTILTEAAPPEKEALYGALGIYPDKNTALSELIDNSGEYGNTTTVKIVCEPHQIIISDDGAGLNLETMVSMFRIKRNEHSEGETGKFGYGFKSATSFLGDGTTVLSLQDGNFTWGKAEPNDNWQYEIKSIPQGDEDFESYQNKWNEHKASESSSGTTIIIPKLKEKFSDVDLGHLQVFVSRTYAINFKKKNIDVTLNGNKVDFLNPLGRALNPEFDKKVVKLGDLEFKISFLLRDNEKMNSGLTIVRNDRIIASGYSMGIPGITDPAMSEYQIVLWCDNKLDDYLRMTPMKTISPNQAIDRGFRRAFFFQSGLVNEIKKTIESAPTSTEVFVPLSQHTKILTGLEGLREKLPRNFSSYINTREAALAEQKPRPPAVHKEREKIVSIVSAPKFPPSPTTTVTTTSVSFTSGLFNIDLKPLGETNFMWDVEERLVGDKLQIVAVFNYDIPFVRGIISGPRNEVAKDFINDAIAQIIYSKIILDESIHNGYKNTYRNISRIKSQIFGG
jgi:hypothetical protein|tara:strand:+ start:67 stop:1590 length:1524 start_codon:yes stop_codon:yes gene_type:complete